MKWLEWLIKELREHRTSAVEQIISGVQSYDEYQRLTGLIQGLDRAMMEARDMMARASREDTD